MAAKASGRSRVNRGTLETVVTDLSLCPTRCGSRPGRSQRPGHSLHFHSSEMPAPPAPPYTPSAWIMSVSAPGGDTTGATPEGRRWPVGMSGQQPQPSLPAGRQARPRIQSMRDVARGTLDTVVHVACRVTRRFLLEATARGGGTGQAVLAIVVSLHGEGQTRSGARDQRGEPSATGCVSARPGTEPPIAERCRSSFRRQPDAKLRPRRSTHVRGVFGR